MAAKGRYSVSSGDVSRSYFRARHRSHAVRFRARHRHHVVRTASVAEAGIEPLGHGSYNRRCTWDLNEYHSKKKATVPCTPLSVCVSGYREPRGRASPQVIASNLPQRDSHDRRAIQDTEEEAVR